MSKVTWVGPGVFGNDVLPGQPLPEGVDPATVKRLIAAGKAVVGDLPAQAVVNDELAAVKARLAEAQETAEGWKNIAGTNANAHSELMIAHQEQVDELAASQQRVTELSDELTDCHASITDLTEQLTAAQTAISELTDQLMAGAAGAGPKQGKEKPK